MLLKAREPTQQQILWLVFSLNCIAFVVVVAGAQVSGSVSLWTGAIDNAGDALTYGLSAWVISASAWAKARVALFKGLLILLAAFGVLAQIGWRVTHPEVPEFQAMGGAALFNLIANLGCLVLLLPHRSGDINMRSSWICAATDVVDGICVLGASVLVFTLKSGWPDVIVGSFLFVVLLRSSLRVIGEAWRPSLIGAGPPAVTQDATLN